MLYFTVGSAGNPLKYKVLLGVNDNTESVPRLLYTYVPCFHNHRNAGLYQHMYSNSWQGLSRNRCSQYGRCVQVCRGAPGGAVPCKLHKIQDPDGPELKSGKNLGKIQMAGFVEHGQT